MLKIEKIGDQYLLTKVRRPYGYDGKMIKQTHEELIEFLNEYFNC